MTVDLTAVSYNVRYANPSDDEDAWPHRRDEVAGVIRFYGPDVVGLQEADHEQVSDLRERVPELTWLAAGRPEGTAGEYAAVGYDDDRFEAVSEGRFWLSETPGEPGGPAWDAALPRLVRHIELRERDTNATVHHVNTHFDHRGQRARAESARLLRDRLDDMAGATPLVLTGDLNCRPDSEPYGHLVGDDGDGRRLVDSREAADELRHGPVTTMTDFSALIPDKMIDYVFVSPEVDVGVHAVCADSYDNGSFPSDHLPVLAELSVPER
jgi:endonuclease/exonuclease/phosphatase family metal-dependent hydrolase